MQEAYPNLGFEVERIVSRGDKILDIPLTEIGGKGFFTSELESALTSGKIDLAVHSLKDLPTETSDGVMIGAISRRANACDVLVAKKGYSLKTLPKGARVGTTSTRRSAQILNWRPDLHIESIRGNVDTRIKKARASESIYDAIVLARAGLERLGRLDVITEELSFDQMLPAPGQGALGIQCCNKECLVSLLKTINNPEAELATTAERAFLARLGGGCSLPIAAFACFESKQLNIRGRIIHPDGLDKIDVHDRISVQTIDEAYELGANLAQKAITLGAKQLLKAE